jgi:hypothetical protein
LYGICAQQDLVVGRCDLDGINNSTTNNNNHCRRISATVEGAKRKRRKLEPFEMDLGEY